MNKTGFKTAPARLGALLRKEYLQFWRDRSLIYIVLYVFILEIYLAGNGFNIEVKNYPTAIFDRDRTQWSVQLAEKFRLPYFRVSENITTDRELVDLLNQGTVSLAVVIPHGFARSLMEKNQAAIQIITDGTLSNTSLLALGYADQITQRFAEELSRRLGRRQSPGTPPPTGVENPGVVQSQPESPMVCRSDGAFQRHHAGVPAPAGRSHGPGKGIRHH